MLASSLYQASRAHDHACAAAKDAAGAADVASTHRRPANNEIRSIEHLDGMAKLHSLFLQENRITTFHGLDGCPGLQRLWLANNQTAPRHAALRSSANCGHGLANPIEGVEGIPGHALWCSLAGTASAPSSNWRLSYSSTASSISPSRTVTTARRRSSTSPATSRAHCAHSSNSVSSMDERLSSASAPTPRRSSFSARFASTSR